MLRNLPAWSLATLLLLGTACTDSLVDVCEEAQSSGCTTITGDCSEFVEALDRIASAASCSSQYGDYEVCATSESDVCSVDNACAGQETALGLCIAPYCLANAAECTTIQDVF